MVFHLLDLFYLPSVHQYTNYKLVKFLVSVLESLKFLVPVLESLTTNEYTVKDSFTFAE